LTEQYLVTSKIAYEKKNIVKANEYWLLLICKPAVMPYS
jgi:hypothetical protein